MQTDDASTLILVPLGKYLSVKKFGGLFAMTSHSLAEQTPEGKEEKKTQKTRCDKDCGDIVDEYRNRKELIILIPRLATVHYSETGYETASSKHKPVSHEQ